MTDPNKAGQRVVVLGASNKPERYSYKAFKMLQEYGHTPLLVGPKLTEIEGVKVYPSLDMVEKPVDTLTMYVGAEISTKLESKILALRPMRVIFNPGSENSHLSSVLQRNGITMLEACTLVLLRTNQF
jgi:hypothetical protein